LAGLICGLLEKGIVHMRLCRRLFAEIYQILKKEEYHYYRDSMNHEKKMMEYQAFLASHLIYVDQIFKKAS
jgi:hypothetical protein